MYGKMMIEELKRFFNTDELKPSIVVLDVGVFFPYANQDILKFDMGLNELPLDAGRFDDMKFNHRYPNRNYVTLSCINERKISRVGYPIIGEVAEMTGEKYLCMDYGIGDSNKISIVVPIMFNLTEDAPCATIQVRMNLRNPNEPTFSIHVHIPLDKEEWKVMNYWSHDEVPEDDYNELLIPDVALTSEKDCRIVYEPIVINGYGENDMVVQMQSASAEEASNRELIRFFFL